MRKKSRRSGRMGEMMGKEKKAREYLAAGYSVTETAFALDFSSSSYFSVLFRQIEDMPPSTYGALHKHKR